MEERKSGLWGKRILILILAFLLIAAAAFLLKDRLGKKDQGTTTEELTEPDQTGSQTPSASAAEETTAHPGTLEPSGSIAPSESTAPPATEPQARTIDRKKDVFLNRFETLREYFVLGEVLDYDLTVMQDAALKAYVEAAGESWDDYKEAVPVYGPEVTVIRHSDGFLDRLGEISELVAMRVSDTENTEDWQIAAYDAFVAASGDVYAAYLTEKEWADMQESSSGEYCGIGVQVAQNFETLVTEVVTVFSNSPAKEAGIRAGDILWAVNGEDIKQKALDEIVVHIRGEEGTTVDLTIYRPSTDETLELTCERRKVEVDTVFSRMLTDSVGYIQLLEFEEVSVRQVEAAIKELQASGMQKLIFDLRGNPGGLLSSVLEIADYFVKKGLLIFRMEYNDGRIYTEQSRSKALFDGDMILLVDGNSASASEVMTGIMQDYGRALVMGEQTFGKGIVQSFYILPDGDALKVTIAHYFSPKGRDFHGVGIAPDILGEDDPLTEDDELIKKALDQWN